MRIVVATLVAAALLFAGCSSKGKEDPVLSTVPAAQELGLEATEETGVIVGVVTDRQLRPMAGVTVSLPENETIEPVVTGSTGTFGFEDLAPGLYVLRGQKDGWNTTTLAVEVRANVPEPDPVHLTIDRDPETVPYVQLQRNLFFVTGGQFGILLVRAPAVTGNGTYVQIYDVAPGLRYFQGELAWEASSPLATTVDFYCGVYNEGDSDWTVLNVTHSKSPATVLVEIPADRPVDTAQCAMWPRGSDEAAGLFGMAIEQKYDLYTTSFYYTKPMDGWTFVADGEHPQPE